MSPKSVISPSSSFMVKSPNTFYDATHMTSLYASVTSTVVESTDGGASQYVVHPKPQKYVLQTEIHKPKIGALLVGIGGNNGSTFTAGLIANRNNYKWRTKFGEQDSNWYGSLLLSSGTKLGLDEEGNEVIAPLHKLVPICNPDELIVDGWDISSVKLGDAMRRAAVLDIQLQDVLYDEMQCYQPMKAAYDINFIADNQTDRADNILCGDKSSILQKLRDDIKCFKKTHQLDNVVVLWTANTERFTNVIEGVHNTSEGLMKAIQQNHTEISPSILYAVASILENCSYINGSPQNTFVDGVIELAIQKNVFIGGNDFKSGQTKLKSVLVDFLVSAGMKVRSIVSYNHLGNNDGCNLSNPPQFRTKEVSKSTLVDSMIAESPLDYGDKKLDHTVVIKYVPSAGDSKRALDEYVSEIFMNGVNTLSIYNQCEDSLLAVPLMLDMILLTELADRIKIGIIPAENDVCHTMKTSEEIKSWIKLSGIEMNKMHSILSYLGYMCKSPLNKGNSKFVVNSLSAQRMCIVNILRACVGLPSEDYTSLNDKLK